MARTQLLSFAALALLPEAGFSQAPSRAPNDHGAIPILEYHLITDRDSRWGRSADRLRHDLQMLYDRGYRPITVSQLVDKRINIPPGTSPVVVTFDDASPGQFRYLERNGALEIDPNSAVGIWLEFSRRHPDWGKRATFCVLPSADSGHAFFGDKGIEGQKTEWRFRKLRFLADEGFELCAHTIWHANLARYSDHVVQEEVARGVLAIDSAITGYRVRTFALPFGKWPRNRALAASGAWRDPRDGREVRYAFDAILEVSGPPVPSPLSAHFDPRRLTRIQVFGSELEKALDRLERGGERYVAAGSPRSARRRGSK